MLSVSSPTRPRAPRKTGRIVLIRDGQVVPREREEGERRAGAAQPGDPMAARTMARN
jgi:hypothetical protein